MKHSYLLSIACLFLLVLGSMVFLSRPASTTSTYVNSPLLNNEHLDSFMIGARATDYDSSGQAKWRARAKEWHHFNNQAQVALTDPFLEVLQSDTTFWQLEGKHGWIFQNELHTETTHIQVIKDVKMKYHSDNRATPVTAYTEVVEYFPKKHTLETDAPVKILSKDSTLKGKGLFANVKDGYMKLRADVVSQYVN